MLSPLDFLKELVKIDSTNPPGNERLVAIEIKILLDSVGIRNELIPYDENRVNLIAYLDGSGSTEKVLGLTGHMDVVPIGDADWKYPPFSATEVDGKLYGRGTSDMKGGLVALLYAMIHLKEKEVTLEGNLKLLITFGEEVGALGAKEMVKQGHMDDVTALIIAEPTDREIYIAEKGVLWLEVETFGKTAHGSTPHLGVNAIDHMYQLIKVIKEKFQIDREKDDLLGRGTLNISMAQGGVNTNVVPDSCRIQIDLRTVPQQSHQRIIEELHILFKKEQKQIPLLNYDLRVINDLPAFKTEVSDPFYKLFHKESEMYFQTKKEPKGIPVYTDGAILKISPSIPAIIFGPGILSQAHQTNEYIEIDSFHQSISFFERIILSYLSK